MKKAEAFPEDTTPRYRWLTLIFATGRNRI